MLLASSNNGWPSHSAMSETVSLYTWTGRRKHWLPPTRQVFRAQRDQHIEEHHHPCPAEPANEWLVPHSVRVPLTAELDHTAWENPAAYSENFPIYNPSGAQAPQAMSWTLCSVRADACRAMVP